VDGGGSGGDGSDAVWRRRQGRGGGGKAAAATQRRRGGQQRQRRPRVAGALLNGSGGMWATDFKHHGAKAEGWHRCLFIRGAGVIAKTKRNRQRRGNSRWSLNISIIYEFFNFGNISIISEWREYILLQCNQWWIFLHISSFLFAFCKFSSPPLVTGTSTINNTLKMPTLIKDHVRASQTSNFHYALSASLRMLFYFVILYSSQH